MFSSRLWLHASRCLFLFLAPISATHAEAHAQCAEQFAPHSGEPGKDVMWVATIDESRQRNAARGIEYNPQLVRLAECHARVERVADKVSFRQGDRVLGTQVEIVVEGFDAQPTTLNGEIVGDTMLLATTRAGAIRRYAG